jgi:large subunit ribosomal protein L2
MAIKKHKPTSAGRRFATVSAFDQISASKPEKALVETAKRQAGRSSSGRISIRHRGGGHKKKHRVIDFRRDKRGIPGKVAAIEYDPGRSANIALLHYVDGEKRYILAPLGLRVGDMVVSGDNVEPARGNSMPLEKIPLGSFVHNVELKPGKGGQLVRGAGGSAQLMSREGEFANLKLPSGEIRLINTKCYATVGRVGNTEHGSLSDGKAGRRRWRGIRPTVRGVVMNPVDHPMGGGEGRSSGGGHPVSPWGRLSKSGKTRKRSKTSNKFIVKRRK